MTNEQRTHEQITNLYKHNFIWNSWITEVAEMQHQVEEAEVHVAALQAIVAL
jgi:hypothetical protein